MTDEEFRNTEGLRTTHAEYLHSPTGLIALSILREKARLRDVPSGMDPIASVRLLSQYHGYNTLLDDLVGLSEPLTKMDQLPPPDWGVDPEAGDHLPSQVNFQKLKEMQDARERARNAAADAAAARSRE